MSTNKSSLDYPKLASGLFTILLGITSWFSVTMYEKITKIEGDIQQLLVSSGVDKTEISNLKERVNNLEKNRQDKKSSAIFLSSEGILPDETITKQYKKRFFASK